MLLWRKNAKADDLNELKRRLDSMDNLLQGNMEYCSKMNLHHARVMEVLNKDLALEEMRLEINLLKMEL